MRGKVTVLALTVDMREENEKRNLGSRHRLRHLADLFF